MKKISFLYLSLLIFPAFFWIKQDAHAVTSFVNESRWNQTKNLFALTKRNFRVKRNFRTKRNFSKAEVIKQWDFEENLIPDSTLKRIGQPGCTPDFPKEYIPKDFMRTDGTNRMYNFRKGYGGDAWIATKQGYRSQNSLAIAYQKTDSSCNNTQKMEYPVVGLGSFNGLGIFDFGLVRYTGFALKLGETLNPNDSTYFESPNQKWLIVAQWRQDSSANPMSPILAATIEPVKGNLNVVDLILVSQRGTTISSVSSKPFKVRIKKAQWYSIVVATHFNAPSTGQMGFVELYVNGQKIKVRQGQNDNDPSTLYKWEQNIGYSDLRQSNNSNSIFALDIYRPTQLTRQTVFFDKIRITTGANNQESDEARMLAEPSKW
jgi:hypothetical protein